MGMSSSPLSRSVIFFFGGLVGVWWGGFFFGGGFLGGGWVFLVWGVFSLGPRPPPFLFKPLYAGN